jgi:hypothetical protein
MNTDFNNTGEGGIEERLWNYIDGTSSAEEKSVIENISGGSGD